jgi:hypothetical protein
MSAGHLARRHFFQYHRSSDRRSILKIPRQEYFKMEKYVEVITPVTALRCKAYDASVQNEILEIFGTVYPYSQQVAAWKNSWNETSPHFMEIPLVTKSDLNLESPRQTFVKKVKAMSDSLGIHPYLWDILCVKTVDYFTVQGQQWTKNKWSYRVVFYKPEHMVLFKLAW